MPRIPLRTLEDAPEAARARVESALKANGFLPNLIGLLANAPVALEAYQKVSGINARGGLTLAEREAVQNALTQSDGNVTQAAKLLDVSRPTLYDLMRYHNVRA